MQSGNFCFTSAYAFKGKNYAKGDEVNIPADVSVEESVLLINTGILLPVPAQPKPSLEIDNAGE